MIDVVCDPNVLEVGPTVLLPSLAEVDVQVVQGDWWVGPGQQCIVIDIQIALSKSYLHMHCTIDSLFAHSTVVIGTTRCSVPIVSRPLDDLSY